MEELLHYVWKHKIFPLRELKTTDGRSLEIINPGILNHDAGPDFKEAKIKIDGIEWAGNVELHIRTSDWFRHGHDTDKSYDNIILHVALNVDIPLRYKSGEYIPQLQLEIPDYIRNNYSTLISSDYTPRCAKVLSNIPQFHIHGWMSSLMIERLEMRTEQIFERNGKLNGNWEDTFFVTIARNFGFGKNGDAFELWAKSMPTSTLEKHKDNLFQIEAIFLGQAGLLNDIPQNRKLPNYYIELRNEYKSLKQKYSLNPIDHSVWKFLRLRPQNFPHIRIAQLAMLYHKQQLDFSKVISANSIDDIHNLLKTQVSEFWETHYSFTSEPSRKNEKNLTKSSLNLLVINGIAPIIFAYGKYKNEDNLCEFALSIFEKVKPECNHIINNWKDAGIKCESAADTQALIQLTHGYCERHECLRCRFGYEFISRTPGFLKEK